VNSEPKVLLAAGQFAGTSSHKQPDGRR